MGTATIDGRGHPFATSVGELAIAASVGSAAIGGDCQTAQELLIAADTAMYAARSSPLRWRPSQLSGSSG